MLRSWNTKTGTFHRPCKWIPGVTILIYSSKAALALTLHGHVWMSIMFHVFWESITGWQQKEEEKEAKTGVSLHVPLHPRVTHRLHLLLLALIHYELAGTMPHRFGTDATNPSLPYLCCKGHNHHRCHPARNLHHAWAFLPFLWAVTYIKGEQGRSLAEVEERSGWWDRTYERKKNKEWNNAEQWFGRT